MNKYSPKAREVIKETMEEYKDGKLRSGQSNEKVTSRKQAIAIGISKARDEHLKVPNSK